LREVVRGRKGEVVRGRKGEMGGFLEEHFSSQLRDLFRQLLVS